MKNEKEIPFTAQTAAQTLPACGFMRVTPHGSVWMHANGVEVHVHMGMTAIMVGSESDLLPLSLESVLHTLAGHGIDTKSVPTQARDASTVARLRADAKKKNAEKKKRK